MKPKYLQSIANHFGFNAKKILRKTPKHTVLLVSRGKKQRVWKISKKTESTELIETEVRANQFLRKTKPKQLRLRIPASELRTHGDYTIGEFEYVSRQSLQDLRSHKLKRSITKREQQTLIEILAFLDSIPRSRVPTYFLRRSVTHHAKRHAVETQKKYLDSAVHGGSLNRNDARWLARKFKQQHYKRSFQHHDVMFWNMMKDARGNIILHDSEFARWGMRWYDLAYLFVQTSTYAQSPDLARSILTQSVDYFEQTKSGENIRRELLVPLYYLLGATFFSAIKHQKLQEPISVILRELQNDTLLQ